MRPPHSRSHTDKTILLVRLGERYVPIAESAVVLLPLEGEEGSEGAEGESERGREGEERGARSGSERLTDTGQLSRREGSRSDFLLLLPILLCKLLVFYNSFFLQKSSVSGQ